MYVFSEDGKRPCFLLYLSAPRLKQQVGVGTPYRVASHTLGVATRVASHTLGLATRVASLTLAFVASQQINTSVVQLARG